MRIAVITSSYPRYRGDGTAPFVKSICEHLAKLGHEIEVVAPYDVEVKDDIEPQTVPIHRFRYIWPAKLHLMGHARSLESDMHLRLSSYLLLPFFLVSSFLALMHLTFRQRSQVIHAHWVLPNGLVAAIVAKLRNIPLVISLHGSDIYISKSKPIFRTITRWIFSNTTLTTACSQELAQWARTLGSPENLIVLPWGADPEVFTPQKHHADRKRPFQTNGDDIVIGSLGRFVDKKGFFNLITALSYVIKEYQDVKLVLGGDGALRGNLIKATATLGIESSVIFPGRIPWNEVPAFLANLDIFVLPSIHDARGNVDGLPTVLLEAMSCGVAVIVSDIGGSSLVIVNEQNGLLIPSGNTLALAEAILSLIKNPIKRSELGAAARQDILTTLNWESFATKFTELLEIAIWRHDQVLRLGAAYRLGLLDELQAISQNGLVLDVGCLNGYFLSGLNAELKIGVDLFPIPGAPNVVFVCADGCHLPFKDGQFDFVYAMDVIEHVENDRLFAQSLKRVVTNNGKLFLSTPSLYISMFPRFLNRWINRKWGHNLRTGYKTDDLLKIFNNGMSLQIIQWNAPLYRFFYLLLRSLALIFPKMAPKIARSLARFDSRFSNGDNGFYVLEGIRESELIQDETE